MLLERLFNRHPHSVGESYLEHQRHAFAFGGTMVLAGIACILHGLVPAMFSATGSRAITRLYDRMVLNRSRHGRSTQVHETAATLLRHRA
jgi:Family of unknown function (DUF6356)